MNVAVEEQETVINFRRNDTCAIVWTSDTTIMYRLDKQVEKSNEWELIETHHFSDGSVASKTYRCPKKLISFRSATSTRTVVMTEEQKKAAAERLKAAREKKKREKENK